MLYLVINAGSSSVKCSLYDSITKSRTQSCSITNIGASAIYQQTDHVTNERQSRSIVVANHTETMSVITGWLQRATAGQDITAIGHRLVHGGPKYLEPCIITDSVLADLNDYVDFSPLHLPAALAYITHYRQLFRDTPHIACFDTAFYKDLPAVAATLALPRRYGAKGVRRYGFHGLSYGYILDQFRTTAGETAAHGRVIMAHLGNGASLTAIKNGQPIDTSMGMTPLGGIPMSTRSGDIDPGALLFLARQENLSTDQLEQLLNHESGMLGISETTGDMKQLLDKEAADNRAGEAIAAFCYGAKKYIGAYAAAMGGVDSLIFTGGIGEVAPLIRQRICDGLEFLGITLDDNRNQANDWLISADGSGVGVHVIPTDEAQAIVIEMARILPQEQEG